VEGCYAVREEATLKKLNDVLELTKAFILGTDTISFDEVALALYEVHAEMNPIYKKYAMKKVDKIHSWKDIPAMPMSEFNDQMVQIDMNSEMPFPGVLFKHARLRHYIRDTEHMRAAILRGVQDFVLDGNTPSPQYRVFDLDHWSGNDNTSYMAQYLGELLGTSGFAKNIYPVDSESLIEELAKSPEIAVVLFGYSYNYDRIYQDLDKIQLHPDSKVIKIDKGHKDNHYLLASKLGLNMKNVVRMYQHPLMSTQIYSSTPKAMDLFTMPHTARLQSLPGKVKRTEIVDVANVWSCPFIRVNDVVHINDKFITFL